MPTITLTTSPNTELEQEFELDVRIALAPAVSSETALVTTFTVRTSKCTTCTDACTVTCGGQFCTRAC